MNITQHRNRYAFDSMFFEVNGTRFQLTGNELDRYGNWIDHIKNLDNGKRSEMSRPRLVELLVKNGYKVERV